jgi:RNA recognition motif-containing protein
MTMMAPQPLPLPQPAPSVFGDTTLTKVFVGGLAWETHKDTLREHFERYGDILEAVIISDKLTGRSKGYGFVSSQHPLFFRSFFLPSCTALRCVPFF